MSIKPPPDSSNPSLVHRWLYDVYTTLKVGFDFTGLTATVAELNNIDGTTSNIQTQLDTKLVKTSNLSDVSSVATARTNLGLGDMALENANAIAVTGGTLAAVIVTSSSVDSTPIGSGSPSSGTFTSLTASSGITCTGDLALQTIGNKISVPVGSNATAGSAVLVGGTVTVANTAIGTNSLVFLSRSTTGGTVGHLSYTKIDATSLTINSSSATDTSTINWWFIN